MIPEPIKKFIDIFSSLPSIGPRQATRLAFYITNLGKSQIYDLAKSIADLQQLKTCSNCFFINNGSCPICCNSNRKINTVCVIEKETDLISIERAKKYNGVYLVLGELNKTGSLSPDQKLKLKSLKTRAPLEEIILAINPTAYGDLNAALILQEIKPFARKITRLGRGIPTGGEIEFPDPDTQPGPIDKRKKLK